MCMPGGEAKGQAHLNVVFIVKDFYISQYLDNHLSESSHTLAI